MASYITNVATVVRVDGQPQRVAPSTRLPDGVSDEEIARLLRFDVIREAELDAPAPADEPSEEEPPALAAEVTTTAKSARRVAKPDPEQTE